MRFLLGLWANLRELLSRADWPLILKTLPAATILVVLVVLGAARIDSEIAAPLFALVAAAGLCISVNLSTSRHPGIGPIRYLTLALSAASSVMAALMWLDSVDRPLPWYLVLLVGVLVGTGVVGLLPDKNPSDVPR